MLEGWGKVQKEMQDYYVEAPGYIRTWMHMRDLTSDIWTRRMRGVRVEM